MSRRLRRAARRHLVQVVQLRQLQDVRTVLHFCRALVREHERTVPRPAPDASVSWAYAHGPHLFRRMRALECELLRG